jgi:hypothetical protein
VVQKHSATGTKTMDEPLQTLLCMYVHSTLNKANSIGTMVARFFLIQQTKMKKYKQKWQQKWP